MYPRKPLPYTEQIRRMRSRLRKLKTNLRHRYDDYFEATGGRRDCPLEVQICSKLLDAAKDAVALAEASLIELRRQEAMFYAPHQPGELVTVETRDEDGNVHTGDFLITDVRPHKRWTYFYVADQLTKSGHISKRVLGHWIIPTSEVSIRVCDRSFEQEAAWIARYYQECADTSRVLTMEKGDLTLFERVEGRMGSLSFRRKDRPS